MQRPTKRMPYQVRRAKFRRMIVRVVIDQLGYVNGFILPAPWGIAARNAPSKPPRFSIGVIWPGNPSKPFDLPNKDLADLMKKEYERCKIRDAGRGQEEIEINCHDHSVVVGVDKNRRYFNVLYASHPFSHECMFAQGYCKVLEICKYQLH